MGRRYSFQILLVILCLFSGSTALTAESERILDFNSEVRIHADGSMTVTETIQVVAMGKEIKRGIYRTFPTKYRDRFGNRISVDFQVAKVTRNGNPEQYHTESMSNGIKLYIGDRDVFIKSGRYIYKITYQTSRQLGYFDDFDELYWNVTGSDWGFVIESAEATINLPPGATIINAIAYTGNQGDQGKNYSIPNQTANQVSFRTTKPLQPKQGMTVAVSWPKGFVPEPTVQDRIGFVFKDNPAASTGLIGIIILLLYYIVVWFRIGRDPEKGTIIPLFSPHDGISPAAARYILKMGYNDRVFTAAIVNMAVKGFLRIEDDDGEFTLVKTKVATSGLSPGERKVAGKLFANGRELRLKRTNHRRIKKAIDALKNYLKLEFEKIYFARNRKKIIPGVIISFLTLIMMVLSAPQIAGAAFMAIWLSGWSIGSTFLVLITVSAWRRALANGGGKYAIKKSGAILMTLFSLPFVIGEIVGFFAFSFMLSLPGAMVFILMIGVNILFYQLMKAPTLHGRSIMDKLEGFKMYLEFAEGNRLNFFHPPEKTPELFEKYLPYAIALNVENAWSAKFADVLANAAEQGTYSPGWYSGSHWHTHGISGMASNLGTSFSSAITSSSSAPGSSSGSSGGGSSGGGGGGGGGGGW